MGLRYAVLVGWKDSETVGYAGKPDRRRVKLVAKASNGDEM